eukprot:23816-Eustigmatos_ZCMA.PRE.1
MAHPTDTVWGLVSQSPCSLLRMGHGCTSITSASSGIHHAPVLASLCLLCSVSGLFEPQDPYVYIGVRGKRLLPGPSVLQGVTVTMYKIPRDRPI